ncbi:hypothetical protein WJ97_13145 [Burkholderia ubonensis]|uniref:hypothetical protein n=1 Tax=Burkholderia ubonensis TaxID=101571 RepID=UPI000753A859|nr:hypothetical protein [Burkholderia ubonensis]KVP96820.1 hypothetical protein WJ97_13145 [Burkholderia ubonensis]
MFKRSILVRRAALAIVFAAHAGVAMANQGGKIHFVGSIVEPPCSTTTQVTDKAVSIQCPRDPAMVLSSASAGHNSAVNVRRYQVGPNAEVVEMAYH